MGAGIDGPAIVTRPDTTTMEYSAHYAAVDNSGILMGACGVEAS